MAQLNLHVKELHIHMDESSHGCIPEAESEDNIVDRVHEATGVDIETVEKVIMSTAELL